MTAELGLNLAGVERVFELEDQLDGMARKVQALERRAAELRTEVGRLEALRREIARGDRPVRAGARWCAPRTLRAAGVARKPGRKSDSS